MNALRSNDFIKNVMLSFKRFLFNWFRPGEQWVIQNKYEEILKLSKKSFQNYGYIAEKSLINS